MNHLDLAPFAHDYDADVVDELPNDIRAHYFFGQQGSDIALLVRFVCTGGAQWVGGFGGGTLTTVACTSVVASPRAGEAIVVSRGRAYAVDVHNPDRTTVLVSELVMQVVPYFAAGLILFADPWVVRAYGIAGMQWTSKRLSVEGLKIVGLDERGIRVRFENPDGAFEECHIDLRSGEVAT
ncbi:MAG: hypothetical protein ACHREM_17365 [Polyangiales bacterium]